MVHTIKSRTVNETQPYPAPYQQFNTAYTLSSDERITTMEAELFNLKKAREVQVAAVRTRAQHQNRAPANNTDEQDVQQARKAIPRIDEVEEAAPRQPTVSISNSQPTIPEHEYFTLPHTFRADPTKFRPESEWNGRNGRNLVGMRCQ